MQPTTSEAGRANTDRRSSAAAGATLFCVVAVFLLIPPGTLPYPPGSQFSDAELSHWPNALFLRGAVWNHHQWPLWNPDRMLGQPFAANPLSKVWYPPQWLTLLVPPTAHLDLLIYLHLGWLTLGMMVWIRGKGLHPLSAAMAGIGWALNPKLMAHLGAGHLDLVYALAWTPWLFWTIDRMRSQATPTRAILCGGTAALLILADLRIAFYMLPVGVLYTLANHMERHLPAVSGKVWFQWLLVLLITLLLTAVQTVPLLALSPYLTRSLITPEEAAIYSLPPGYLIGAVFANAGGFHEWATYLGVPAVALALLTIGHVRRKEIVLWWVVGMAALLWSLGSNGPLFLPITQGVPIAGWFRVPSRAWFVVVLAVTVLSAYGLEQVLRRGLRGAGRKFAFAAAFAGVIWALAAASMGLPNGLMGTGGALAGAAIGLWIAGYGPIGGNISLQWLHVQPRVVGATLLILVQTASVLVLDSTLVEGRRLDLTNAEVFAAAMGDNCSLVYSPSFALIGAAPVRAGIPTLHGVDPFQLRWSAEAIAQAAGLQPSGYSITAPPLPVNTDDPTLALARVEPDYDLLRTLGVSYLITRFPIESDQLTLQLVYRGEYLFRLRQAGGFVCGAGPNRLVVEVTGVSLDRQAVVITHAWAPGWRAWVDGRPASVERADNGLMRVSLPKPDSQHIELVYRPLADFVGAAISAATVIALCAWWIADVRRCRREA